MGKEDRQRTFEDSGFRLSVCLSVCRFQLRSPHLHPARLITALDLFPGPINFSCAEVKKSKEKLLKLHSHHKEKSPHTHTLPFYHILHSLSSFLRLYTIYFTFLTYFLNHYSSFFPSEACVHLACLRFSSRIRS